MNEGIKMSLEEYTRALGRDAVCASLATLLNIGDDQYGVTADEMAEYVDEKTLKKALASGLESYVMALVNDEDMEDEAMDSFMEYVADEDGEFEAINEEWKKAMKAAKAAAPAPVPAASAPAPAPTPVSSAPAPAPAPAVTVAQAPAAAPAPAAPAAPVAAPAAPAATTANYANFISDSFEAGFDKWDEFRQCVMDMENTETVYTHDDDLQACGIGYDPTQPNLKITPVTDSPIMAAQLAKQMQANVDAVLDTMLTNNGTGLALDMHNGRIVPIGASAIEGMCARAGFTNDGFLRNWKKSTDEATIALNRQYSNGKGGVTVIERCGKIRAVCSRQFAYGKYSSILDMFEAFWKGAFPKGDVQNMYISHSVMRWELNLDAYKADIFNGFPELMKSGFFPVLQFITSNTADAAFRIMPALQQTGGKYVVPICSREEATHIRHTAAGNYGDRINQLSAAIQNAFTGVKSMMDGKYRDMDALKGIQVVNAYNAILRTMDDCGIPKKQGMEAAVAFKNFHGNNPATAFECFAVLVNAYSFVVRDNPQKQEVQFKAALAVGRAAGAPWEARGNIPGDYSWK